MCLNSLIGRIVLFEFICNLCNQIFLNFLIMKLLRDVKVIFEALPTKLSYAELTTKVSLLPLLIL